VRNNQQDLEGTSKDERDPELAQAEADVARTRERVAMSVMALRDEMARRADWREWVRSKPAVFITGALVLGFIWGYRR
jgi:hypothetical protein